MHPQMTRTNILPILLLLLLLQLVTVTLVMTAAKGSPAIPTSISAQYRSTVTATYMSIDANSIAPPATPNTIHLRLEPITNVSFNIPFFVGELMLPNVADGVDLCGSFGASPRAYNELNETFVGKVLLVRRGICGNQVKAKNAILIGAIGMIMYGCSVGPPTNCQPNLLSQFSSTIPINGSFGYIQSADGELISSYLAQRNIIRVNGGDTSGMPPVKILTISTGPMNSADRTAFSQIISQTTAAQDTGARGHGELRPWNQLNIDDSSRDPCLDRIAGIWCENGHIVSIYMQDFVWSPIPPALAFPSVIGNLIHLRQFVAQNGYFGSDLPDSFCALTGMKIFNIVAQKGFSINGGDTGITSLPTCLSAWTDIQSFSITSNSITGSVPDFKDASASIQVLELANNRLTLLPASMKNWVELTMILAANNRLTNFPSISKMDQMLIIDISSNYMIQNTTANAFDCASGAKMSLFDISKNFFSGPVPNFLNCNSLVALKMNENNFTGQIPTMWTQSLNKIVTLNASKNFMTSPASYAIFGSMNNLARLDLSYNMLTTSISSDASSTGLIGAVFSPIAGPSLQALSLAHNLITGDWRNNSFQQASSLKELSFFGNNITSIPGDLFALPLQQLDLGNCNIQSWYLPSYAPSPAPTYLYLNLRGNPQLSIVPQPSWMIPSPTGEFVIYSGQTYSCPKIVSAANPQTSILLDPGFTAYTGCKCNAGTFGVAPECYHVPLTATLDIEGRFVSSEVGVNFDALVMATSDRTITPGAGSKAPSQIDTSFDDAWYGENRLTLGISTSFIIDLSANSTEDHPIRYITVRLHIDLDLFSKVTDQISVTQGSSSITGHRVLAISGTSSSLLAATSSSAYTESYDYQKLYGARLATMERQALIEVDVLSDVAVVTFQSRDTTGRHFLATYSSSTDCPPSYFYDIEQQTCRPPLELYNLQSGIRSAVFVVSGISLGYVVIALGMLGFYYNTPVIRASSRPFMILILVFLGMMALGASLYAAVPDESDTGRAICNGRTWLAAWPLTGVLSVIVAKTNRLSSIFTTTSLQIRKVTDSELLGVVAGLLSIMTIFLSIYSGLPLTVPRVAEGTGSLTNKLVSSCHNQAGFEVWIAVLLSYLFILILGTSYLAFKTRDLPSRFNESNHMMNAIFLLLFYGALIVPLDFFIQSDPEAAVLIQGLGQALLVLLLTSILFVPKYIMINFPENGTSNGKVGGTIHGNNRSASGNAKNNSTPPVTGTSAVGVGSVTRAARQGSSATSPTSGAQHRPMPPTATHPRGPSGMSPSLNARIGAPQSPSGGPASIDELALPPMVVRQSESSHDVASPDANDNSMPDSLPSVEIELQHQPSSEMNPHSSEVHRPSPPPYPEEPLTPNHAV